MRWGQFLRVLAVFMVVVMLHYTLRPFLGWRTAIDFLVIALLLVAVRVRPGLAALIGFGVGLMADSLSLGAFGSSALAMAVVGFSAAWLKAVFFADNLPLSAFFFFLGKWAYDVLFMLVDGRLQGLEIATQMFVWSPLSAAVTAIAGVALLVVLRPMLERRRA